MDHLEPDAVTPIGAVDDDVYTANNQRALLFGGMLLGCLIFALMISQLTNDSDEVSLANSTVQQNQAAIDPTNQVPSTSALVTTTSEATSSTTSSSSLSSITTIQNNTEAVAAPSLESDDSTTTSAATITSSTTTTPSTSEEDRTTTTRKETTTTTRKVEEQPPAVQVADKVVIEPLETLIDIIREQTTTTVEQTTTTEDEETTTTEDVETTTTKKETTTTAEKTTTTSKPAATQNPAPTDEKTVWVENFSSLDSSKWSVENNSDYGISKEVQCYMGNNVKVSDGKLVLTARKGGSGCSNRPNYSSGMVRGKAFSFSPGQVLEFRVKLTPASSTNQAGLFPAVWSSSWDGRWPRGGEFDYLEVMTANNPTKPFFSMHYQKPDGSKGISNKFFKLGENFTNNWHTVRVEYRRGDLRWFINGNLSHTVDYANTAQGWPAPFDRTINDLKINLALGGNPGTLDPRALGSSGAKFEMDYIKVSNL